MRLQRESKPTCCTILLIFFVRYRICFNQIYWPSSGSHMQWCFNLEFPHVVATVVFTITKIRLQLEYSCIQCKITYSIQLYFLSIYVFNSFFLCCKFLDQVFGVLSVFGWVYTTHQTPDSKTSYMRRKNQKHRCLDTKYNFILFLILHFIQLYFNYIPTVF